MLRKLLLPLGKDLAETDTVCSFISSAAELLLRSI